MQSGQSPEDALYVWLSTVFSEDYDQNARMRSLIFDGRTCNFVGIKRAAISENVFGHMQTVEA